ncbi:hypothetical protein COD09_06450 [Bacillus cereus]|uniref:Uncharacterized protein n=1 Tax=Bacillus cereus TaxID=1396 RepID=A0A2C1DZ18_BACCE|nr:hypothetical protein COD09_06450 [Bacillus cereus]
MRFSACGADWRLMITNCLLYKKVDSGVRFFEKYIQIYPALTGSKTPTSKFSESKEVRWGINCP